MKIRTDAARECLSRDPAGWEGNLENSNNESPHVQSKFIKNIFFYLWIMLWGKDLSGLRHRGCNHREVLVSERKYEQTRFPEGWTAAAVQTRFPEGWTAAAKRFWWLNLAVNNQVDEFRVPPSGCPATRTSPANRWAGSGRAGLQEARRQGSDSTVVLRPSCD